MHDESLKEAEDKIKKAKKVLDADIKKITSPFDQKKKEFTAAMKKSEEPFKLIKAKQMQAKTDMDAAKNKADAAKEILDAKGIAHKEGRSKTNKVMSDAKVKADKAKKGIEDRQKEFLKAGDLVKSLIAKIESQGKAELPGKASGGRI